MKNLAIIILLFLLSSSLFSQEICLYESFFIRINYQDDVPTIQNNQEDNTIILTHKEQYITDIFAKYKIYGFSKAFPSAQSEVLQKTYSISTSSRSLLIELSEKVPNEIFWFEPNQVNLNIINFDVEVIRYFNNENLYKFEEFTSLSESCNHNSDCPTITNLRQVLNIYYEENSDFLVLEGKENSFCIKPFYIKLKQVSTNSGDIRLIVWEIDSENTCLNSDLDEICQVEKAFFETIKLYPILKLEKESFTITGSTPIFTENIFRFTQESLSVTQENLQAYISISQNKKKDLLSIKYNSEVLKISEIKIFDFSGREVLTKKNLFHSIELSFLNSGIYFLKVKMNNGLLFYKKILKS